MSFTKTKLHSFREGKGVHSAMKQVKYLWKGVSHFIHIAIEDFFTTMNVDVMLSLLREQIDDELFLNLVRGVFKAQLLGPEPNRSVLTPILTNIYLCRLDETIDVRNQRTKQNQE